MQAYSVTLLNWLLMLQYVVQVDALLEDRQIKADEVDSRNQRDSNKIQYLSDQYNKSQSLLYESTKDYLQVKYELRAKEREWIAEKDKLLQELDLMREQLSAATGTVHYWYSYIKDRYQPHLQ